MNAAKDRPFKILTLDGGGSHGFYTIGVLEEVEALFGKPLSEEFDLIYGTSTGSIIGSLIALGYSIKNIRELYKDLVPSILGQKNTKARTKALKTFSERVFKEAKFEDVKTRLGVVSVHWDKDEPCIFKSHSEMAHSRISSFKPGFGFKVSDAVKASASAWPFFEPVILKNDFNDFKLIDGGYSANNPVIYAITDALFSLKMSKNQLRVLSVGVGSYPPPKLDLKGKLLKFIPALDDFRKVFEKSVALNSRSMEIFRSTIFKDVHTIRISEACTNPKAAVDFLSSDLEALEFIKGVGATSYSKYENEIKKLLGYD